MLRQSPTRTVARSTSALAEFHDLAGHAGAVDDCGDCAATEQQQRQAAAALRSHQRQTRQQIDAVLDSDLGDEQADLIGEAAAFGLHTGSFDDSPEGWGQ